jgi:hypothetical protein
MGLVLGLVGIYASGIVSCMEATTTTRILCMELDAVEKRRTVDRMKKKRSRF